MVEDRNATYLQQAVDHFSHGRMDAAEDVLRQAVNDNGPDERLLSVMAVVLRNKAVAAANVGRLAEAEVLLREVMGLATTPADGKSDLAKLLLQRALRAKSPEQNEQAARWLVEAIGLWPDFQPNEPFQDLSRRLTDYAVAIHAVDSYLAAVLILGVWLLDRQDVVATDNLWRMLVQLGSAGPRQGGDVQQCEAILRDHPDDYVALICQGNALRLAGRLSQAEKIYRRAIAFKPDWPFAASRLACVLTDQRRFAEANELFIQAASVGGCESMVHLEASFVGGLRDRGQPRSFPGLETEIQASQFDFVLAAGCDGRYFQKFSEALFRSIAKNCRGKVAVHVHLVDADEAARAHAEELRRAVPTLPLFISTENSDPALGDDSRRTYYTCTRFRCLPAMLRHYRCPVLVLDIDLVVLRDVGPLLSQLKREQADVALVHGSLRDPWCALWADIVLAAPTVAALDYFDLVSGYIDDQFRTGKARWFIDQVALFACLAVGYQDRAAPSVLALPMDIQNSDGGTAYFWSLHQSTPGNEAVLDGPLYQSFLGA